MLSTGYGLGLEPFWWKKHFFRRWKTDLNYTQFVLVMSTNMHTTGHSNLSECERKAKPFKNRYWQVISFFKKKNLYMASFLQSFY